MFRKEIWIHALFWGLFMVDRSFSVYRYYLDGYGFLVTLAVNITDIAVIAFLFYAHYAYLAPRLLRRGQYAIYAIAVAILLAVTLLLQYVHALYISKWLVDCEPYLQSFEANVFYYIFKDLFYLLVSAGAGFTMDWFKDRELREALAGQKIASELAMLKYQISPHFLHNTLHNINYLVTAQPERASDSIVKLSELMRYMLHTVKLDSIPLADEIRYIEHFVELQKIRLSKDNVVDFSIEGDVEKWRIKPLLLISFVENAFKHGDVFSASAGIRIVVKVVDNMLNFEALNGLRKRNKERTPGIGIENVKRRLELLYPARHELVIERTSREFSVKLQLELS